MTLSAYVGSLACPAATGNQSVTGLGFQPKLVLFYTINRTTDGTDTIGPYAAYGAAVSSTNRFALGSDDITGSAWQTASKCVTMQNAGTITYQADFVSMDSGGFTINWSTVSSGVIVQYLALGGTDLASVTIQEFTCPAATGNQSTTGVGFKPDAVLFFSVGNPTAPPSHDDVGGNQQGCGCMTSAAQWVSAYGNSANSDSYQGTASCIAIVQNDAKSMEAKYVSLDSDGFTLNWTTVSSGAYVWAICLKGPQFYAGSFSKPTATGNSSVTGLGFQPAAELFSTFGHTATTAILSNSNNIKNSFGAAVSSTQRGMQGNDGYPSSQYNVMDRTKCVEFYSSASGSSTVLGAADFVSQDSGGFTLNWTTVDASAEQILYLAIGPASSGTAFMPGSGGPAQAMNMTMTGSC